jgi:hypothetical protein
MGRVHPSLPIKLIRDILVLASGILSALYLLNISFGVAEFIPDNIPIFGNLDEAAATGLLINCLAYFGVNVGHLFRRKTEDNKPAPKVHDIDVE